MADNPNPARIQSAWLRFVNSLRDLLVVQPDDRPLDQYLKFRDEALALVESKEFLDVLQAAWPVANAAVGPAGDLSRVANLVRVELDSSADAAEVAMTLQTTEAERKEWLRKLLGRGSTVTGSVKDIRCVCYMFL